MRSILVMTAGTGLVFCHATPTDGRAGDPMEVVATRRGLIGVAVAALGESNCRAMFSEGAVFFHPCGPEPGPPGTPVGPVLARRGGRTPHPQKTSLGSSIHRARQQQRRSSLVA